MKILALDTSTKFLSIGLYNDGVMYEYNLETGVLLSDLLEPTLMRILDALDWGIDEIDYFACGLGPGSFTGIRVGLAFIKGLGWSLGKPLVGVSTLSVLAKQLGQTKDQIIPVIDAKRSLLYCGFYKSRNNILVETAKPGLLTCEQLFLRVQKGAIFTGDGIGLYKDKIIANVCGAQFVDKDYWYPKAHNIILLALEKIKKKQLTDAFKLEPIYLYPKECQIRKPKND